MSNQPLYLICRVSWHQCLHPLLHPIFIVAHRHHHFYPLLFCFGPDNVGLAKFTSAIDGGGVMDTVWWWVWAMLVNVWAIRCHNQICDLVLYDVCIQSQIEQEQSSVQCAVCSVQCAVCSVQCAACKIESTAACLPPEWKQPQCDICQRSNPILPSPTLNYPILSWQFCSLPCPILSKLILTFHIKPFSNSEMRLGECLAFASHIYFSAGSEPEWKRMVG